MTDIAGTGVDQEAPGEPGAAGAGGAPARAARERLIPVEGTYNLRDTGGYRAGGRLTRWGALYRSDALHGITPAGRSAFEALGIGTILDLRDEQERSLQPTSVHTEGITLIEHPIFPSAREVLRPDWGLAEFYRWVADEHPAQLASAVRAIADADPQRPVLVHCTAGKDRTGTVVALALTAVGVDRDDVLDDYARTEANISGAWLDAYLAAVAELGVPVTPQLIELASASPAEVLEGTLAHLEARHGSVPAFLRAQGVPEASLERLETRLLGPRVS